MRINVIELRKTCEACPAQWSGTTDEGKDVYVRYRWGTLRITVDDELVFHDALGDGLDGFLSEEKLYRATSHIIRWPGQAARRHA